jgi:large subunit ribosomal protein L4
LPLKISKGKKQGELEVKFALIENGKGTQAVHDTVVAYRAAQRSGTACTKKRRRSRRHQQETVAAKGHRPRPRRFVPLALVGGGGVVFGPRSPAISARKFPKNPRARVAQGPERTLKAGDVVVVDDLKLASPKTKDFVGLISALELKGTTLVISNGIDKNLTLASRNIPKSRPDDERFAQHLRRAASRQTALHPERV